MRLLPSLRQKKRYIVFESSAKFSFTIMKKAVDAALHDFLGQLGLAKATPQLLREKYSAPRFIIKVSNRYVDECKSALMLITHVGTTKAFIRSVNTSGTLKKASTFLGSDTN
jgi:RNase P/RNase MRP subunit POP5